MYGICRIDCPFSIANTMQKPRNNLTSVHVDPFFPKKDSTLAQDFSSPCHGSGGPDCPKMKERFPVKPQVHFGENRIEVYYNGLKMTRFPRKKWISCTWSGLQQTCFSRVPLFFPTLCKSRILPIGHGKISFSAKRTHFQPGATCVFLVVKHI